MADGTFYYMLWIFLMCPSHKEHIESCKGKAKGQTFCPSHSSKQIRFAAASSAWSLRLKAYFWCEGRHGRQSAMHHCVSLGYQKESRVMQRHVVHQENPVVALFVLLMKKCHEFFCNEFFLHFSLPTD